MNPEYQRHLEWVQQRRQALEQRLAALLPEAGDITLEIGCGHGHWLTDYASAFPEKRCLGVDIIGDRIERAQKKASRAGATNLSFVRGEAFEVLDLMPEGLSLSEVFILFPDPWPKKRHWKNRLFNTPFLQELARRCAPGVRCHFRTDHEPYFEWAEETIDQQTLWKRDHACKWPYERETVFQKRADRYQSLIIVRK